MKFHRDKYPSLEQKLKHAQPRNSTWSANLAGLVEDRASKQPFFGWFEVVSAAFRHVSIFVEGGNIN